MTPKEKITRIAATFFGVGYSPFAPGTMGSLAGLALGWFFIEGAPILAIGLSVLGFAIGRAAQEAFQSKDPKEFVLDEVAGMLVAVAWIPFNPWLFAAAFGLFRLFDIWKPWPASVFNRMKHPAGIMLDDLFAGVLANACLHLFLLVRH